jgi:hypothetical protein
LPAAAVKVIHQLVDDFIHFKLATGPKLRKRWPSRQRKIIGRK